MSASYQVLLSHLLDNKSSTVPSAVQAALSHQLAFLKPLPTPLAATAVSSPFYCSRPVSHDKLQSLAAAFRRALHLKLQAFEKVVESQSAVASLFVRDTQSAIARWTIDVVKGLQGGQPIMRLACLTGLVLGVEDIIRGKREQGRIFNAGRGRNMVENELVIAVAEIVDSYGVEPESDWEREFKPTAADPEALPLSLILASQSLPLISRTRLKALPMSLLNSMLVSIIKEVFHAGRFLSLNGSTSSTSGPLRISDTYGQNIKVMMSSPVYSSIASLSKLTALTLEVALDTRFRRIQQAMETVIETLSAFEQMASVIETDWCSSPLPGRKDEDIEPTSRDITKNLWSILKTFLFSTVMVAQAPLATIIYVPSHLFASSVRPHNLALEVLNTLYHLSFIVSEFGGISPDSNSFVELKQITYLALDILTQVPEEAEHFVRHICSAAGVSEGGQRHIVNIHEQVKRAFALVCLEQLVPVLSTDYIRYWVWQMCYPHLSDTSHRDLYESAHSVILTILAARAPSLDDPDTHEMPIIKCSSYAETQSLDDFVTKIIPFYAQCLIENSGNGKLSTAQVQLAYAALVRSTAAHKGETATALAWYCIELLLDGIRDLSNIEDLAAGSKEKQKQKEELPKLSETESHLHRLHLMLIATVPSLPLSLMSLVLTKIKGIMVGEGATANKHDLSLEGDVHKCKAELMDALFSELLERVGDREKEAAMRWWYDNLEDLEGALRAQG